MEHDAKVGEHFRHPKIWGWVKTYYYHIWGNNHLFGDNIWYICKYCKFHHDLTVLPNPGNHGLDMGESSPNGRKIQVSEILSFTQKIWRNVITPTTPLLRVFLCFPSCHIQSELGFQRYVFSWICTDYYGLLRLNMISLEGLGMILAEPSVIEVFMFGPGSTQGAKDALMYDHVGTPCRAVSDDKSPQLVRVHMHACRFVRWGKRTTPCRHRKLFDLFVTLLRILDCICYQILSGSPQQHSVLVPQICDHSSPRRVQKHFFSMAASFTNTCKL